MPLGKFKYYNNDTTSEHLQRSIHNFLSKRSICLEVLGQLSKTSWTIKQDFVGLIIFFKIRINSYSVIKCKECLHGMREVFDSNPGRALYSPPLPCDIWWLSVGLCSDCEQRRDSLVSLVPAPFWADSGTYLFKQGEIVTGRSSGSSARMVWGTPGFESQSVHVLFPPVTFIPWPVLMSKSSK